MKAPDKNADNKKEKVAADAKQTQEAVAEPTAQDKTTLLTLRPVFDGLERALRPLERNQRLDQQQYNAFRKDFFRQCDLAVSICQRFSEPFKQNLDGAFQALINGIDAAKQGAERIDAERKQRLLKESVENDTDGDHTLQFAAIALDDIPEDDHPHLQYKPASPEAAPDDFSRALVQGGEQGKALLERFEKNAHEMNTQDHEGWTPVLQLATHGHTQLLQDSLRIMTARWYAPQKKAYDAFNEKGDAEFLTVVTFDAPVNATPSEVPAAATQKIVTIKRPMAFSDSEFKLFSVFVKEDSEQPAPVLGNVCAAAPCLPAKTIDTAAAGSAGNTVVAAPSINAACAPPKTAQPANVTATAAAGAPAIEHNNPLMTRHYFVNSKRLRPFLCRSVMLPKQDIAKIVVQLKTQRPTAVALTGPEAYFFTKHLDVRARTYPNISVIDDELTQQRFQKEHAEYQGRLQAAIHGALDLPQQQQPMPLEAFFALETPPTSGIPVKPVRDLIAAYLETDFPHEVRFARPNDVVHKKKDKKCSIQ